MDQGSTGVYDVTLTGTLGPEGGEQQPITLTGSMSGAGGGSGEGGWLLGAVTLLVRLLEHLISGADEATLRQELAELTDAITGGAAAGAAARTPPAQHRAAPGHGPTPIARPPAAPAGRGAPDPAGGARHRR